jgi:hypothetical protein
VEEATLTLLTDLSQPMATTSKTLAKGMNVISIPAQNAANGLYFIVVQQGNKKLVRKVIIQK